MRRAGRMRWRMPAAVVLVALVLGAADLPGAAEAPLPTTVPPTSVPATTVPPATVPPTVEPSTDLPPPPAPPEVSLAAGSGLLSPNGDGRADRRPVTVTVDVPVSLTLEVRSLRTSATATLARAVSVGPGAHRYVWGGRLRRSDGTTVRAPDGRYEVVATATAAAAASTETDPGPVPPTTATTVVTVDTRPPSLTVLRVGPEPWSGTGPLTTRFAASDPHGPVTTRVTISRYRRTAAATGWRARGAGGTTVRWRPRPRGRVLTPGGYEVRVVARDAAGNTRRSAPRPVRVHRRVPNRLVNAVPGAGRRVAITIDDCYDAAAWSSMLTTLERMGAGATFFCNGQYVRRFGSLARRTVRNPRISIGSHSTDHADLTTVGYGGTLQRLLGDEAAWWDVARTSPAPWFRPPYGAHNTTVRAAAGDASFTATVLWDLDTNDWRTSDPGTITARALQAKPGSIVLLHTKPQTARALPAIIAGLRARGLRPVGLHEMLAG